MNENEAKKWVKDKANQRKIIAACVGDNPRTGKLAIFMAGIPGAGKTEFVHGLQGSPLGNFTIIEHDQLVEQIETYTPEHYYDFRKAGSTLVTELFEYCLKKGCSFIFDGTLSHDNGFKNIQKALKYDYAVIVIYIHQDIQSAWQLTKDRELVKKRSIERQGFIETCQKITVNLKKIFTNFADNKSFAFWIVQKHGEPGLENATTVLYEGPNGEIREEVESVLNANYNIDELEA
jgi:predicted ABC-type ATPase